MIRIEDIKWSIDEDEKEALANLPVNVTITGNDEKRIRIDSEGDETELLDLIFNWLTDTYEFCIESTGDISLEDDTPAGTLQKRKGRVVFCAIKKITKAILPMPDTTMMSLSSTHLNVSGIPCVIASITDI